MGEERKQPPWRMGSQPAARKIPIQAENPAIRESEHPHRLQTIQFVSERAGCGNRNRNRENHTRIFAVAVCILCRHTQSTSTSLPHNSVFEFFIFFCAIAASFAGWQQSCEDNRQIETTPHKNIDLRLNRLNRD